MKPVKKKPKKLWIVFAMVGVLIVTVFGAYQIWFSQPSQESIDAAMKAQDWRRAVNLLERADLREDAGENHYNMALAYSNLGESDLAIQAYMRADNKDYKRPLSRYEIACIYAEAGEDNLALEWLRDAFDSGFTSQTLANNDDRLEKIRTTEEFQRVLDPIRFEEDAELGGLDFLIGIWNGSRTTTVSFNEIVEGRVISETWSGVAPGGTSGTFVLDPETERWTYSYIDGWGRFFTGNVQVRKQIVTITGTLTYAHGEEIVRKIDIRSAVDVIDYVTSDSPDGGVTFYPPQLLRLNPATNAGKPTF